MCLLQNCRHMVLIKKQQNNMNKLSITILFSAVAAFTFTSCEKDDKKPENPSLPANPTEIITTVKLTLTEEGSGNTVVASWKDADGDGPGQPVINGLALSAGKTYTGALLLLDESKLPADTISNEVEEEHNVHQFFYTLSGDAASRIMIEKSDKDDNNLPVGLQTRVTVSAGTAATGMLKIMLKHYDGVLKSNDSTVGETDVEANFPVTIQ
jgi:hypothetical protein